MISLDIRITPGKLRGTISVPPSKSQAHRYLICAALGRKPVTLICPEESRDLAATAECLRALGAEIERTQRGYRVEPIAMAPAEAVLPCGESGSTLRFLLPVAGALGVSATFVMEGRLPERPLSPLLEEMARMGCSFSRPSENTLLCRGKLKPGAYSISGSVSSQFVSGLLFAASLMPDSTVAVTGRLESAPYVAMTEAALALFRSEKTADVLSVEGDWSSGAFWLAAKELGNSVSVQNLSESSLQGDRAVSGLLPALREECTIPAEQIPDLVPILSVVTAANKGALFTGIRRLRTKESDRVAAILAMIHSLGGQAEANDDTLRIYGTGLVGGEVDSFRDHRIAMSAAIASTICSRPVVIRDAECVKKSYPRFWEEFRRSGGLYEQHLR